MKNKEIEKIVCDILSEVGERNKPNEMVLRHLIFSFSKEVDWQALLPVIEKQFPHKNFKKQK